MFSYCYLQQSDYGNMHADDIRHMIQMYSTFRPAAPLGEPHSHSPNYIYDAVEILHRSPRLVMVCLAVRMCGESLWNGACFASRTSR